MSKILRFTTIGAAASLTLAVAAAAVAAVDKPLDDSQIQAYVERSLVQKKIAGVDVGVADGVVTLRGTVPSEWARQEAVELASQTHDVQSVKDQLTITSVSDETILHEATRKLATYVFYSIFDDVSVGVHSGVITLTGVVTMPYKSTALDTMATKISGVRGVHDELRALPVSIGDDQIRATIATQIYMDPLFHQYAFEINPPIHIVVENGHVRLTGMVLSTVERMEAESIARSVLGVLSVSNELRIEQS